MGADRVLAAGLVLALVACGGRGELPPPPDPDLSGVEPGVAAAIREARRVVTLEPRSAEAWGRLGEVLDVHEFLEAALACYEAAEQLDPDDFRWPYFAALCMDDRRPQQTVAALRRAHAMRPDDVSVNLRLGRGLLSLGEDEAARLHFEAALRGDPASSHARWGLAKIAFARGDLSESRALLERAAADRPDHPEVAALLARVYRDLGLDDLAAAAAEKAGSASAKTPIPDPHRREVAEKGASAAHLSRAGFAAARDGLPALAIERFGASLEARPNQPDVRLALVHVLLAQRRFGEAIATLTPATDDEPPPLEILNTFAWLRATLPDAELRDGAQAVETAERVLRAQENPPHWHWGTLGAAYAEAGRFAEAVEATDLAIVAAERAGDRPFVEGARRRRELFARGEPFHGGP
jgi:tetratricopeptide (TPR) repeat protein